MVKIKLKAKSVLYEFMLGERKKGTCIKCGRWMITFGESDFYIDHVCTKCGKELLEFLREHRR